MENNDVGTLLQRDGRATETTQENTLWLYYCVVTSNTVITVLAAVWNKADTVEEKKKKNAVKTRQLLLHILVMWLQNWVITDALLFAV